MSPESLPEVAALQKITAQKGVAERTTVMTVQGCTGMGRQLNPFERIRQGLQ